MTLTKRSVANLVYARWCELIEKPVANCPKNSIERFVSYAYFMHGQENGLCYCCGKEPITLLNFNGGHIKAKALGGSDFWKNLRPICTNCNSRMGMRHMVKFMYDMDYDWVGVYAELDLDTRSDIGIKVEIDVMEVEYNWNDVLS